ncbi:RhoGEF domain-containing protein, partial [Aphelenchoides avenae]
RHIEVLHEFQSAAHLVTPRRTASMDSSGTGNRFSTSKAAYVLEELISTEQTYVRELQAVVDHYIKPFEAVENTNLVPSALRGQSDAMFGNLRDILDFHDRHILSEFLKAADSPVEICHIFINQRGRFLSLYRPYCQNKPMSEALRRDHADSCKFFADCQKRAGHLLPLSAYLLKPVQRITKYQLLLKEMLRYGPEEIRHDVQAALAAMLDLLAQINADMQQLHILGFA